MPKSIYVECVHRYEIIGRKLPSKADASPKAYRMVIFAKDPVTAKSNFWYYMKKLQKVKKTNGEILQIKRVKRKDLGTVKNYGITFKWESRTGIHNMYKEFRDISVESAVAQLYSAMAGQHKTRSNKIHILSFKQLSDEEVTRDNVKQFLQEGLKFPHLNPTPRPANRRFRNTFQSKRPRARY